jgi:hypothetical protein
LLATYHFGSEVIPDDYVVPAARRIHELHVDEIQRMLKPLRTEDGSASPKGNGIPGPHEERLRLLMSQTPSLAEDRISGEYLNRLISGQWEAGHSLHLVVMDLHKELNRLQQQLVPRQSVAPVSMECARKTVR